jgi:hypothetical protein
MKYTLNITIKLDSDWPDDELLEKRERLEDQLQQYSELSIVEVGAGLSSMAIIIETNNLVVAKQLIDTALQTNQLKKLATIEVSKPTRRQNKVQPGDLFAIQLPDKQFVIGIVLHVSKRFKNGILVGLYDQTFNSISNFKPADIASGFYDVPNYTGKDLICDDIWPRIGHDEQLLSVAQVPYLAVTGSLYYKDDVVKQLKTIEEYKKHTTLSGQGRYFIENKLAKHFRRDTA